MAKVFKGFISSSDVNLDSVIKVQSRFSFLHYISIRVKQLHAFSLNLYYK